MTTLQDLIEGKYPSPQYDLTAQDVFHVGVNYGNELKAILINSLSASRLHVFDGSLLTATEIQNTRGEYLYANDQQFRYLVDHTLEQIIAVLAVRRITE